MKLIHCILCLLVGVAVCSTPAMAVILEVTVTGIVEEVSQSENLIVFSADSSIGYQYDGGSAQLVYKPLEPVTVLEFSPPNPAAFEIHNAGETAAVTMLGGLDGTCIAIGRLQETPDGDLVITDLVGDPYAMPLPLVGEYSLTYDAEPDSDNATGTTAPAVAVNVTLSSEGMDVFTKRLLPGESFTWNGRNDGSVVDVSFISGEASSTTIPGYEGMVGPQPISTFVVAVTPPIGLELSAPLPATATPTATATATATATPATPGLLGLTAVAGLAGAVLILRRP